MSFLCQGLVLTSYEPNDYNRLKGSIVNEKNLNRAIRVRNINRNKRDLTKIHFGAEALKILKASHFDIQESLREKIIEKFSFRTSPKFKRSTIQKFKSVNGFFFGETKKEY